MGPIGQRHDHQRINPGAGGHGRIGPGVRNLHRQGRIVEQGSHAELLAANAPLPEVLPTPATLQRQLKGSGELRISQQVEPSTVWVELLARTLKLDSTLRISISGAQAEAWREALIEQRVRASRLELGEPDVSGVQLNVLR